MPAITPSGLRNLLVKQLPSVNPTAKAMSVTLWSVHHKRLTARWTRNRMRGAFGGRARRGVEAAQNKGLPRIPACSDKDLPDGVFKVACDCFNSLQGMRRRASKRVTLVPDALAGDSDAVQQAPARDRGDACAVTRLPQGTSRRR